MGRASAGPQWLPDFRSCFVNGMDIFVRWYRKFLVFGNFKVFEDAEFKIWAEIPLDRSGCPISDHVF